jgi:acyl carrier protein
MTVTEQLKAFIRESFLVDDFGETDSFLRAGIIDSMGMLQLVDFIEESWGIPVADEDIVPDNFDSLANVAAYVERRRQRQSA